MGYDLKGYSVIDIIRQNVGSPATNFAFSKFGNTGSLCESLMINNLGSNNIFVAVSGTPGVGSTMILIPAGGMRSMDIRLGSVQILTSGGNVNTETEVVGFGI